MREIQEVRLVLVDTVDPIQRVIGKFVGNVAFLRDAFAVHIQARRTRKIRPLSFETHPSIEAGLWIVAFTTHMPLAHEAGAVAGPLQILREEVCAARNRRVVVHNVVAMRVHAGQD